MATNGLGRLTIDMIMRTAGFEQGMSRAERRTKQATRQMAKDASDSSKLMKAAFKEVAKVAGGVFTGISAAVVVKRVIDNTSAMISEQAQLAAVLRSTGEAAGFNRNQLNAMADALGGDSIFSTNEINQAQTALLAFTGIMGNEFVRAQQAAADMSARTGMMIGAAMETIGRALDVPSKGLAALSRQGFRFTEEQAKLALYLESTGRTAEAQAIVLQALEESYGGAARAARDNFGGAVKALQNNLSTLMTGGEGSLDGARQAVERLNEVLASPEVKAAFSAMVTAIISGLESVISVMAAIPWGAVINAVKLLATFIGIRLVASFSALTVAFITMQVQAVRYQIALGAMAGVSASAAVGITALGAAATVASRAMALMGGPIGALVLAGTAIYMAFGSSAQATQDYGASLDLIKQPIEEVTKSLQGMTKAQREASLERVKFGVAEAAEEERKAVVELQRFLTKDLPDAAKGSEGAISSLSLKLQMSMGDSTAMLRTLEQAAAGGMVPESVLSSVRILAGNVDDARQKIEQGKTRTEEITVALANMEAGARGAAGGVAELSQKFLDAQAAGAKYLEDITKGNITAGIKTELGRLQALIKAGEIGFASEDAQKAALAGAALRDKLTASTSGAGNAAKKAADAYKALLDQLLPMEKISKDYETDQGMLNAAFAQGKIDIDQYTLAMANLNQRREDAVRNLVPEEIKRMEDLRRTSEAGIETLRIQQERALEGMGKSERWNELANALGAVEDKYRGIAVQMMASNQGISPEQLEMLREFKEQEFAIIQEYHDKRAALDDSYVEGAKRGLQQYIDSVGTAADQMQNLLGGALKSVEDTLFDLVTTGEFNLGDMIRNIGQSVVRMMIQMGVQMAANWAMSQLFTTASAATAVATGAALASAYAPAAALASLASFGANAAPATAGIVSTMGVAQMSAFAGMFDDGGTLRAGQWGIAGEFGPEIIKGPANITSREETMRMLRDRSQDSGNGDLVVQFYGNPDTVAGVEQDTDEFGRRVVRVMLQDWMGGGEYSQALQSGSNVRRQGR